MTSGIFSSAARAARFWSNNRAMARTGSASMIGIHSQYSRSDVDVDAGNRVTVCHGLEPTWMKYSSAIFGTVMATTR